MSVTSQSVTIQVDPDRLECNREVYIFKIQLDSPDDPDTKLAGFAILVPCDSRFLLEDLQQAWKGVIQSKNVVQITVPSLPYLLAFDTQAIEGATLAGVNQAPIGDEVQAGLIAAHSSFNSDRTVRLWKEITLVFPDGEPLVGVKAGEHLSNGEMHGEWVKFQPIKNTPLPVDTVGTDNFILYKVARGQSKARQVARRSK